MRKRAFLVFLTLIIILEFPVTGVFADNVQDVGVGAASYVPTPEISAPSAILIEADTGQILYHKNKDSKLHISVACKLMTALIAIENADMYSNVTVSSDTVIMEGSSLNLEIGAKYPLIELLYAAMLTSANDAAIAIAEHVSSGNIDKFIDKMNETAENLQMNNTYFANPTGLFDQKQYTTAADVATLIKYAIKNPTFNNLFSSRSRPWYGTGNDAKILTNSNRLFWSYDGVEGGKIGYNEKDKQTIVCTASRTNMKLICVVLDAPEETMYTDATTLFNYGFENFWKSTLVKKGDVLKIAEMDGKPIRLISQSDIMYVHPIGEDYIKEFTAEASLTMPLKTTIPAGSAKYILEDSTEIDISLYPETEIVPPDDTLTIIRKKIIENRDIFVLVIILAAIEAILLLFNLGRLLGKLFTVIMKQQQKKSK
jgi:D-alanyl-D-alanine carboxypeptidase (penicillin-binding protein 5/6)